MATLASEGTTAPTADGTVSFEDRFETVGLSRFREFE